MNKNACHHLKLPEASRNNGPSMGAEIWVKGSMLCVIDVRHHISRNQSSKRVPFVMKNNCQEKINND